MKLRFNFGNLFNYFNKAYSYKRGADKVTGKFRGKSFTFEQMKKLIKKL